MANYCSFEIKATGKKEGLERFKRIISADYNYDKEVACTEEAHVFRTWDPEVVEEYLPDDEDGYVIMSGDCAWSVTSCMFEGQYSYYDQLKESYPEKFKGTSIPRMSKELNLDIEIFSEEPGMGFMEHYLVKDGEIIINQCVDYTEIYDEETDEYSDVGGIPWNFDI